MRQQTIQIVKYMKKLTAMQSEKYLEAKESSTRYHFEMQAGYGNILDSIRDGKYLKKLDRLQSQRKLQHLEVKTFLFEKLSMFLIDDKVMFVPKQ